MTSYKVIIAGGRDFVPKDEHYQWIRYLLCMKSNIEFVTGCAKGADSMAFEMHKWMPSSIKEFPADWEGLGRKAGPIRNQQMADYADALIVFPGGKGTTDMISRAEKNGLEIRRWENAIRV